MIEPLTLIRRNPFASLYWKAWDDEFVVFDEASGQTHLLSPLHAYVLDATENSVASLLGILADLRPIHGSKRDREVEGALAVVVAELQARALIEVVGE